MMNKEELKQLVIKTIDENSEMIMNLGDEIYKTPELGFKEFITTETVARAFEKIGIPTENEIAYTGCKAGVIGKSSKVKVAVIGELDSIVCTEHMDSLPNGNVHACGHNVQLANMFGAAIGIIKSGVFKELDGAVDFLAMPAEEGVDYEYRDSLIAGGKIHFYGGKQEYIYRGGFDDVDIAMQCHMMEMDKGKKAILDMKCSGFISKTVKFIGKSAHAGMSPEEGINALNMTALAINNVNALRETFRDEDKIRVSMVIKECGEIANVVPSFARMEVMVRAASTKVMLEANAKVNRAMKAAALAIGGKAEINDKVGYMPLETEPKLSEIYKNNMIEYEGANEGEFISEVTSAISTDLGDVSGLMPCMHIWSGKVAGGLHTKDYQVLDKYESYIVPAKMLALSVVDLLYDGAKSAEEIIEGFAPKYSKEDYLEFMKENTKIIKFDSSSIE
jgi:amidohydrolase